MERQRQQRSASLKSIFIAAAVLAVFLPVFWLSAKGEAWAKALVALIPLVGLVYWLRLPREQCVEAESGAQRELMNSRLGRGWVNFTRFLYAVLAIAALMWLIGLVAAYA